MLKESRYEDNIFINCPFDKQYKPIFNAIVFAIHDTGFVARCSLEEIDSGPNRLSRLIALIRKCKYGIHDISRTELSGPSKLPRFNMPFECGLFWGCFEYGLEEHKDKRILVLDSKENRYRATLSDIAGQDIKTHNNDPSVAIDMVRTWLHSGLRSTEGQDRRAGIRAARMPGGEAIWNHYLAFQQGLTPMLEEAQITREELDKPEYYRDYANFVAEWLIARERKAKKKVRW